MRKWKPPFAENNTANMYYDIIDDYALIEASFAKQYGIRLRKETDMSWDEFCTLLSGIMPETPLGRIISIRAEKNPKTIRGFSKEEKCIYREWQSKVLKQRQPEHDFEDFKQMEQMFQAMSIESR